MSNQNTLYQNYKCLCCKSEFTLRPRICKSCPNNKSKLVCLCDECYMRHNKKHHPDKIDCAKCDLRYGVCCYCATYYKSIGVKYLYCNEYERIFL